MRNISQIHDTVRKVHSKESDVQILDARMPAGYDAGHIKGSISVPFSTVTTDDGGAKSAEAIKKAFEDKGVDLSKPIITSC